MNKQVNKFLQIAYAEIGYVEKASNKNLDSKTGNPGKGNYTKYGRDLKAWTGSKAYGIDYQWCDQFYDWVMVKAFGLDEAKRLLGGWSAYTPTSAQYYKDKNRWHTGKDCLPGDQIFFKNSVRICHTGAVYRTDDTYIYTIEGNTNPGRTVESDGGEVALKKYVWGHPSIAGYGRPAWNEDVSDTTEPGWYTDETGTWYRHTKGTGPNTYYHSIIKEVDGKVFCFNENGYVIKKTPVLVNMNKETGELTFKR